MSLIELGWDDQFRKHFETYEAQGHAPARVIRRDRNIYLCEGEHGPLEGAVSGRFHRESVSASEWPAVGDWVAMEARHEEGSGTIHAVLPRRSFFSRKAASSGGMPESGGRTDEQVLAANIDTLFLVSGLDGDFNLRRIERYIIAAYDSGASPVIVLNKADLCDDVDARLSEVDTVAPGVPVVVTSAARMTGREQLQPFLSVGQTIALFGSSGVGKSTLTNWLLGEDRQKITQVREDDSRGRHTTSHRELIILPGGGILIDTPGMREFQVWSDQDGLAQTFGDITAFAENCRFRDCQHRSEPGCGVRAALDAGELDTARYESYLKLQREIQHLEERKSGMAAHLERQRGKRFAKMVKETIRMKVSRRTKRD